MLSGVRPDFGHAVRISDEGGWNWVFSRRRALARDVLLVAAW
jgi:hypothetical protein